MGDLFLQSHTFCLQLSYRHLPVWIRIRILNTDPIWIRDPQHGRIFFFLSSTTDFWVSLKSFNYPVLIISYWNKLNNVRHYCLCRKCTYVSCLLVASQSWARTPAVLSNPSSGATLRQSRPSWRCCAPSSDAAWRKAATTWSQSSSCSTPWTIAMFSLPTYQLLTNWPPRCFGLVGVRVTYLNVQIQA